METCLKLSPAQQTISDSNARFRVAACGRRFGKSWLAINEVAKYGRNPNQRICIVAPTYRQVKQVFWIELKDRLRSVNWIKNINESELTITLVNNSRIFLRSADNFDSIRGERGLVYCVQLYQTHKEMRYSLAHQKDVIGSMTCGLIQRPKTTGRAFSLPHCKVGTYPKKN